jgi:RHS repeat-associated protein
LIRRVIGGDDSGGPGDGNRRPARSGAPPAPSPATFAAAQAAGEHAGGLLPALALPTGGGAIRGIDEKFATDAVTGSGAMSVPVATSPGRGGFDVKLTLDYSSGFGNGPFGLGWQLSLPAITRKTDKGLPRYGDQDEVAPDVFILSGAEDLVPVRIGDGPDARLDVVDRGEHRVQAYRPRVERLFARIERWTHRPTGDIHWRATTTDNLLSIFGQTPQARVADPEVPQRVFSWLLEETRDDRGNVVRYTYKAEDGAGVDPRKASEASRFDQPGGGARVFRATAQRYLKRVQYGNRVPIARDQPAPTADRDWLLELVLDYGEHDDLAPTPAETRPWSLRADPFSTHRPTFEVRTYRLCRRALMFHRFPELGPEPLLVRSTDLTHEQGPVVTYLVSVAQAGYLRDPATGVYTRAALPPVDLGYVRPVVHDVPRTIDRQSLAGIEGGVDGVRAQWVDLDGEGIPGVLIPAARAWFYKSNRGDGQLGPPALQRGLPSLIEMPGGSQQLIDLGGDGNLDLVLYAPPIAGFFERAPDATFAPFVSLHELPNIDWQDPRLRFLDIDGDGLPDLLLTENDAFVWYRSLGKDGFAPGGVVPHSKDEELGPAVIFADGSETIHLADLSGDGLVDIVRVRSGEVCYWPNLGYGRFGRKITLDASPRFDTPDLFDPRRVRFADLDGSGTADIVYLGRDGVRLYFNQSGNGLSAPTRLTSLPPVDTLSTLTVVDLLGSGTACLVWSTPLPVGPQSRRVTFVDLMGGQKPHLLESVVNNLGAETRIAFAPSTKFYLADKAAGHPWLTRLPFPVQVVERVEHVDRVAKTRLVRTYAYHHGFYDGFEREFRGFARVEQRDAESIGGDKGRGLFPDLPYDVDPRDPDLNLPPVRTVTWFHTGAWLEKERLELGIAREFYAGDPLAPLLPDTTIPPGLTTREEREAARALRGRVLRQEIYAEDGAPEAANPYTVSERDYEVRLIQHAAGASHAVFFVHPRHTINLQYERRPDDPRMQDDLVLDVDDFGNVTRSASIGYPRRQAAQAQVEPEQAKLWATVTHASFANRPSEEDWYRVGVPVETTISELTGLTAPARGVLSVGDVAAADQAATEIPFEATAAGPGLERRGYRREQRTYYSDDLTDELPLGEITRRALPFRTYRMALTPGLVAGVYGARVDEATLRDEGGYVRRDELFWAPSDRAVFDAASFFLPVEAVDPFGARALVRYDVHALMAVEADDALANRTTVVNDYRVLRPVLVTDPNGNRMAVALDALGMVVKTAVMGKEGAGQGDTLDDPTTRFEYALLRWRDSGGAQPAFVHALAREQHGAANSRFQETYSYSDGLGREAMKKIRADPGPVAVLDAAGHVVRDADGTPRLQDADPRWIGTGRTVFDNKGNAVKTYEPFFSATFEFEDEKELVESGVTPIRRYDPLGRLVRMDLPNGTFRKVVFDAWEQETWDENDNVLESLWYAERGAPDPAGPEPRNDPARRAAWLAAQHAGTPFRLQLDSLGRAFLTEEDNRDPAGPFATRITLDIVGGQRAVIDARGNRVIDEQTYDALGRRILVATSDAGTTRTLPDVVGKPLRAWDPRGLASRQRFDPLRRPTELFTRQGDGAERLVELVVYGEAAPDAVERNLLTRIHRMFDGAGLATNGAFDFKGNLVEASRRLAVTFRESPDWAPVADDPAAADALLEAETFTTTTTWDALNRITSQVTPDGSDTTQRFNQANQITRVEVSLPGDDAARIILDAVDYNARGQRTRVALGNGTVRAYEYEPDTFRLSHHTTSRAGAAPLQDLAYEFDPVGNIVQLTDGVSFGNPAVRADGLYVYDPLYRLVRAEGREHPGQQPGPGSDGPRLDLAHPADLQALARYRESYSYDPVGNIARIAHDSLAGPGARWVRLYEYAADSNRLLRSGSAAQEDRGEALAEAYTHDQSGNMTSMPHLRALRWDHADRLLAVDRAGGGVVSFAYDAGGQRARKVYEHDGLVEQHIYLGRFEVFRQARGAGGALEVDLERQTLHVIAEGERIALIETKTADASVPDLAPAPRVRYQIDNHLRSSVLEVDDAGRLISYEEYFPFGSTAFQLTSAAAEVSAKRYRYNGNERDDETGLYYFGARYYAPWLGRWTSVDPGGLIDGNNVFSFVRNNPINNRDTQGFFTVNWGAIGRGALNAAVGIAVGVVIVAAVAATAGTAAPLIAVALGASVTTAATVQAVAVGTVYVAASAYGGYQTGKSVVSAATGEDFDTGRKLTNEQQNEKIGEAAVMVGALAFGGRRAAEARAEARAQAEADQGLIDTLVETRSKVPTPSNRAADLRAKKTFSIGQTSEGDVTPVRESVPKGGPHAEPQTLEDLGGSGNNQTIAVDQVPCPSCDPLLESQLPPGSRVLIPRPVGGPDAARSVGPGPKPGIKAISEAAARGEIEVEPQVILETPKAPGDLLEFAPLRVPLAPTNPDQPTPEEEAAQQSLPEAHL